MTIRISLQQKLRQKSLYLPLALTLIIVGCGGGSSGNDNGGQSGIVTQVAPTELNNSTTTAGTATAGSTTIGTTTVGTATAGTATAGSTTIGTTTVGTATAGTATAGSTTIGTSTVGTATAGTATAGSTTIGTSTVGTTTAGTATAGSTTIGTSTVGTTTAGTATAGSTTTGTTTGPGSANAQQYEDTFLRLSYPEGWFLDTTNESFSAQFFEPDLNGQQGANNCTLLSTAIPGSSLIQGVDEFLGLYDDVPAPQTSFVNVNGTEMARIVGTITVFGVTIDTTHQIAYENQIAHVVQCLNVDPADVDLIFNSMVIR